MIMLIWSQIEHDVIVKKNQLNHWQKECGIMANQGPLLINIVKFHPALFELLKKKLAMVLRRKLVSKKWDIYDPLQSQTIIYHSKTEPNPIFQQLLLDLQLDPSFLNEYLYPEFTLKLAPFIVLFYPFKHTMPIMSSVSNNGQIPHIGTLYNADGELDESGQWILKPTIIYGWCPFETQQRNMETWQSYPLKMEHCSFCRQKESKLGIASSGRLYCDNNKDFHAHIEWNNVVSNDYPPPLNTFEWNN